MTHSNMILCAERCSAIIDALLEAGVRAPEPLLSAQAGVDHALGRFQGARLLVKEQHYSERACRLCNEAGFRLGDAIAGALLAVQGAVENAGKECAHA